MTEAKTQFASEVAVLGGTPGRTARNGGQTATWIEATADRSQITHTALRRRALDALEVVSRAPSDAPIAPAAAITVMGSVCHFRRNGPRPRQDPDLKCIGGHRQTMAAGVRTSLAGQRSFQDEHAVDADINPPSCCVALLRLRSRQPGILATVRICSWRERPTIGTGLARRRF